MMQFFTHLKKTPASIAIGIAVTISISFQQNVYAQAPTGYYDLALGKTGNDLKIALHNTIKGHTVLTYSGLWSAYNTTDKKPGTNKIWDIYSDIPGGTPSYQFTYSSDQCGSASASSEGRCYNREHTFPQSIFGSNTPMQTDLWIVYPTDAFVNGKRMNYPYGEVTSHTWISTNGSKLGMNTYPGAPSTISFEPIDSFKGDIARTYFYIATRYYSQDGGWDTWEMSTGADLKPWAKQMLLKWHNDDPVSQKEINRNNAVYALQRNRNPYIDHPEFANCIFGTEDCSLLLSNDKNLAKQILSIYPNPGEQSIQFKINSLAKIQSIRIYNYLGQQIEDLSSKINLSNDYTLNISDYPRGQYYVLVLSEEHGSYTGQFIKL